MTSTMHGILLGLESNNGLTIIIYRKELVSEP